MVNLKKKRWELRPLISKEEKMIRLLQYLKRYTDKNNPTSLPLIDYYFEEKYKTKNFLGHKTTRRNLIKNLVTILNSDENGNLLPEEEWKLVYDDFRRDAESPDENQEHHICNLYYVQEFSDYEIDDIKNSIRANEKLSSERQKELVSKIEKYLQNKNYRKRGMTPVEKKKMLRRQKQAEARRRAMIRNKIGGGY